MDSYYMNGMNWEVEVYRVVAKCNVSVRGCVTKADAEDAAIKQVLDKPHVLESGQGWLATATTWPYHQTVNIDHVYQVRPPELWAPPTWMNKRALQL